MQCTHFDSHFQRSIALHFCSAIAQNTLLSYKTATFAVKQHFIINNKQFNLNRYHMHQRHSKSNTFNCVDVSVISIWCKMGCCCTLPIIIAFHFHFPHTNRWHACKLNIAEWTVFFLSNSSIVSTSWIWGWNQKQTPKPCKQYLLHC